MRRKGIGGEIISLVVFLFMIGVGIAILKQFNWDLGAAFTWITNAIIRFVTEVANYFCGLPGFRKLFKS